jgi:3-deoxy-manno-octulosonate cytidylyltransferase (CMP-KDO synthetase)
MNQAITAALLPDFWVIIPARYGSTRLSGKPLLDIHGKPMIWHVYQQAIASGAARVMIATDDDRIEKVAKDFGAEVYLTDNQHISGTDRVAEAAYLAGAMPETLIVNVQGDEPLIAPQLIQQTAIALAKKPEANIATLGEPIDQRAMLFNPHIVKIVLDAKGFALYFSRAPIAWVRSDFSWDQGVIREEKINTGHVRHLGIYAYRFDYLQYYTQLPICTLEQQESLEQLRVLFHGGRIYVELAQTQSSIGVDTEEDLMQVRRFLAKNEYF